MSLPDGLLGPEISLSYHNSDANKVIRSMVGVQWMLTKISWQVRKQNCVKIRSYKWACSCDLCWINLLGLFIQMYSMDSCCLFSCWFAGECSIHKHNMGTPVCEVFSFWMNWYISADCRVIYWICGMHLSILLKPCWNWWLILSLCWFIESITCP